MSQALPIDDVLPDLNNALQQHQNVVLVAAPGAGKTTRVPLALLHQEWLAGQRILMLEPRRIATRNAARFMAQQLGEETGRQVGYRMRSESATGPDSRIEVITEGLLSRMILQDPELSGVGLIIFDEFHERNLQSDLGLALAHNAQQLFRHDLKLLVMSATLDDAALSDKLQAPVIRSEGRQFPVTVHYRAAQQPLLSSRQQLLSHCRKVIHEALQHSGDMLVFLPGVGEIQALQQQLQLSLPDHCQVMALHGRLSDRDQKRALTPLASNSGQRKIILATNIAESSVTIDGVRIVIDSGLERRQQFDVRSGIERLESGHISQASAEQRSGRAGRQAPGQCYRLWPQSSHHSRAAHLSAETQRSDLSYLTLCLYSWGCRPEELLWLTPPSAAAIQRAQALLQQLGMVQPGKWQLNDHGQAIADSGLEPRWGHAILSAATLGFGRAAAQLVAQLQWLNRSASHTDDLELALTRLDKAQRNAAGQLAQRWIDTLQLESDQSPLNAALVLALAYPDRLARRRSGQHGEYLLSSGTGACLQVDSGLQQQEWLAVSEIQGQQPRIRQALPLQDDDLDALTQCCPWLNNQQVVIEWLDNGQLKAEKQQRLGQIIWRRQPLRDLSNDDWLLAWRDYFQRQGLSALPWDDGSRNLCQRAELLRHQGKCNGDWPAMDEHSLQQTIDAWLLPLLHKARHLRDLKKLPLYQALLARLDWQQQQQLEQQLPIHWQVASGSRIRLDYSQQPPLLAVKLQEMFGVTQQPALLSGRLPLQLHLLSPAQRPLAVTQDLASFWQNVYPEVRKELRGRYPKHPWPEDPLSATATRFTKKAGQKS